MVTKILAASSNKFFPKSRLTRATWLVALLVSIALLLLPEIVKLDGNRHADWQQFLGRFHPLAVHLPIGLIALVPILEVAGRFRPALRETAGFVLGLACVACFGTLVLGYLLAYGSGETGTTVVRHMWGGIALSICLVICVLARPAWSAGLVPHAYPSLLVCMMLALLWTAHQGGSITHGDRYLTEYMPASLKRVSGVGDSASSVANSDSFYRQHIHPILDANCVSCHGASKTQGGLRLDSYQLLMKGGKDGPVILPHHAENSLLLQRVTQPVNSPHFMPAEGRPPLKPNEISWISAWIQQGASPLVTRIAGISIAEAPAELPPQPVSDYSAMMNDIRRMQNSQGAKLVAVSSKASDGLILSTVDISSNFGDAQLAQFERFAPYIVEADLARTAVTDASFETLSKFSHLRGLHLEGTSVTGKGIAKLASLSQLTYLNLSETQVTSGALAPLASMTNLRHVYLFNTPAQPAVSADANQSTTRSTQ